MNGRVGRTIHGWKDGSCMGGRVAAERLLSWAEELRATDLDAGWKMASLRSWAAELDRRAGLVSFGPRNWTLAGKNYKNPTKD